MKDGLIIWLRIAWNMLDYSHNFMLWNLFLAFIPLILSIWLFRVAKKLSILWWGTFLTFIAFLPNAPYVLTDIIHLIDLIRFGYSVWIVTLVIIPQYTLFMIVGFQAYVISLINLGYYLRKHKLDKYILPVELTIHALCALGIYLGRFQRFNSWDFFTKPKTVIVGIIDNFAGKQPLFVMFITFWVLVVLYSLTKPVNLALAQRFNSSHLSKNP